MNPETPPVVVETVTPDATIPTDLKKYQVRVKSPLRSGNIWVTSARNPSGKHTVLALTAFVRTEDRMAVASLEKDAIVVIGIHEVADATLAGGIRRDAYLLDIEEGGAEMTVDPREAQETAAFQAEAERRMRILRAVAEAATHEFGSDWAIDEQHCLTTEEISAIATSISITFEQRGRRY